MTNKFNGLRGKDYREGLQLLFKHGKDYDTRRIAGQAIAEIKRLEKENAELRERAHYAVVASDLSVERAEQAEAVLMHLWQWLPLNYRRFYGSDYSPAKAIIERLKEQNDE